MEQYLKESLIEIAKTSLEGFLLIKEKVKYNDLSTLIVVEDINIGISRIKDILNSNNSNNSYNNAILYCENILYSINKINSNSANTLQILKFELIPFNKELIATLEFVFNIFECPENWVNYQKTRELSLEQYLRNRNSNKQYKYDVSIVLTAYNKLEYTKLAVESIYQYTDFNKFKIEFLLINNGSDDGTEEYFASLSNVKVVNLKYNIPGNDVTKHLTEGKYAVGFSNDVLASKLWLEKLVDCIESDPNIFWVVPTCNSDAISNNQGVNTGYVNDKNNLFEITTYANEYNLENDKLWEERNILMPFISIHRPELVRALGGIDKLYNKVEFVDDDLSTSLRRVGLKQILAKDTFMHHFGSVTLRDERKNGSLENMREVYYKKWGVDAWDSRGEVEGFEHLIKYDIYYNPKILFIEPKFGANTLNIKKMLRDKGIKVSKMVAAIFDKRYLPDARYMYDQIIAVNSTEELIEYKEKYSLISFGTYINEIEKEDIIKFLESLYHKLENKGQIIFTIKNFRNAKIIFDLLTNNPLEVCGYEKIDFHGCDFDRLFENLSQNELLSSFEVHAIYNHDKEVDTILSLDDSINKMPVSAIERLRNEFGTKYYTFVINKNG